MKNKILRVLFFTLAVAGSVLPVTAANSVLEKTESLSRRMDFFPLEWIAHPMACLTSTHDNASVFDETLFGPPFNTKKTITYGKYKIDGNGKLLDVQTGKPIIPSNTLRDHYRIIRAFDFSEDGRIVYFYASNIVSTGDGLTTNKIVSFDIETKTFRTEYPKEWHFDKYRFNLAMKTPFSSKSGKFIACHGWDNNVSVEMGMGKAKPRDIIVLFDKESGEVLKVIHCFDTNESAGKTIKVTTNDKTVAKNVRLLISRYPSANRDFDGVFVTKHPFCISGERIIDYTSGETPAHLLFRDDRNMQAWYPFGFTEDEEWGCYFHDSGRMKLIHLKNGRIVGPFPHKSCNQPLKRHVPVLDPDERKIVFLVEDNGDRLQPLSSPKITRIGRDGIPQYAMIADFPTGELFDVVPTFEPESRWECRLKRPYVSSAPVQNVEQNAKWCLFSKEGTRVVIRQGFSQLAVYDLELKKLKSLINIGISGDDPTAIIESFEWTESNLLRTNLDYPVNEMRRKKKTPHNRNSDSCDWDIETGKKISADG